MGQHWEWILPTWGRGVAEGKCGARSLQIPAWKGNVGRVVGLLSAVVRTAEELVRICPQMHPCTLRRVYTVFEDRWLQGDFAALSTA